MEKIVIGADIVPTPSNEENFISGNMSGALNNEVMSILNSATFRIFNLETPLYDGYSPIKKVGPNLVAKCATINGLKALGTNLVTLANNHIMDQGIAGLNSTLETLKQSRIEHVGVGMNSTEARKPYCFDFSRKKIGVYACAEHEFSIATDKKPGANAVDMIEIWDHISQLKSECDYVIVLYHGGKEYYRYPSPNLQKICRKLVDKGANLVITQHSHCVGCQENYHDATIVYGQGNFLFDEDHDEFSDEGLLVTLDENLKVDYVPLRDCNIKAFFERSKKIKSPEFVEEEYSRFAENMFVQQTSPFRRKESFPFKVINKLSGNKIRTQLAYRIPEDQLYAQVNFVECEAHQELLLRGLKCLMHHSDGSQE